jgi:ankyrin repeat protein
VKHIVGQLKPKGSFRGESRDREVLVHDVDWKDKDQLAPTSALRSFLFQLLEARSDLFKQIYNRMHDPPIVYEDLEELLVDLLSNSRLKEVDLVIHGINNMDIASRDRVGRTLLRLLLGKRAMPTIKILLTCRKCDFFSREIEEAYSQPELKCDVLNLQKVALTGQANRDFEAYIKYRITTMPNNHKLPNDLRDFILNCLVAKTTNTDMSYEIPEYRLAKPKSLLNNFLWISLVVDLIGSEQSPSKIKDILKEAMEELNDLDSVYDKLITRTPSHFEIVRILRFIQCARRPLDLQELVFAIAIRPYHTSAKNVQDDQFLSLDTILESYAGALVLFQNDTVSLNHPSLSDHLERFYGSPMSCSQQELAKACIWTLILGARTNVDAIPSRVEGEVKENVFLNLHSNPFMHYAAEFWFEHVRLGLPDDKDGEVFSLTMRLLRSDNWKRWRSWYSQLDGKDAFPSDTSPIHIFAALDLLRDPDTLKLLASDANKTDTSGRSVMYYAAANNAQSTIEFLLEESGYVRPDTELLYLAVTKTNLRLLRKILRNPKLDIQHSLVIAAVDGRHWSAFELLKRYLGKTRSRESNVRYWATLSDQNGGTLHHAVLSRNLALVESFLNDGANQLMTDKAGKIPLHVAAQIGDELIAEALIAKHELEVSSRDDHATKFVDTKDTEQGNSPLHYATEIGSLKLVELLTDHGADIDARNSREQTPLHIAARCGHEDIVLQLLALGAGVNLTDKDGTTPLHLACAGSWSAVVKKLLDQGADPWLKAVKDRTPLHLAAANGSREVAGMLVEAGAEIDARDLNRQTPLHAAVLRGSVDLVLMLIEKGAHTSAIDNSGKSPLHYAAASDSASAKIVQLLMEKDADVDLRDTIQHKTALEFAQAEGNNIIAALLKNPRPTRSRTWSIDVKSSRYYDTRKESSAPPTIETFKDGSSYVYR